MHEGFLLALMVKYGYPVIFLGLALGMFGMPIPDETLMVFSGYLASMGLMKLPLVVFFCYIGSLTGITLSFFIGKKPGSVLLQRYGKRLRIDEDKTILLENWLKKYGGFGLAVGYFLPGVRHVMFLTAGIGKMPYKKFALSAYPSGFLWVVISIGLGFFLGEEWERIAGTASVFKYLKIVLLTGVIAFLILQRIRHKKT